MDLIGGVDPHATAEPVHKQEIGILEVSHIFSLFIRIFDLMLVFFIIGQPHVGACKLLLSKQTHWGRQSSRDPLSSK